MLLLYKICVREASEPEIQKHSPAAGVSIAWCLEGDRRVSAAPLLPQVKCLTINTISNSPTQKAFNCVQTSIQLTLLLHMRKNMSPFNPFLITDTSALQHTGATATHAETSLLILN